VERDDLLRAACFAELDRLRRRLGDDLPYVGGLDAKFPFDGRRVPFFNRPKGIHRAVVQRGPAALSVSTSYENPYGDEDSEEGLVYAYRSGDPDQADNRALRAAYELQAPIVYLKSTRPGWHRAEYPVYVTEDDRLARRVRLSRGTIGVLGEPNLPDDEITRRYLNRETLVRLHQGAFRAAVLTAYRDRCTICTLREVRLLDASHIVADREPAGVAAVRNGLALCSIHHRAYDQDLIGIDPGHRVHVADRLRDEEDGPMLDLLKRAHGGVIQVPRSTSQRPDPQLLAERFERFAAA
jgi:putative restriction endonuclease